MSLRQILPSYNTTSMTELSFERKRRRRRTDSNDDCNFPKCHLFHSFVVIVFFCAPHYGIAALNNNVLSGQSIRHRVHRINKSNSVIREGSTHESIHRNEQALVNHSFTSSDHFSMTDITTYDIVGSTSTQKVLGNDPNLQNEQKFNLTDIDETILSDNNPTSCFYCHLLHPEIMPSENEIATSQLEDEEVHCLTRIHGSSFKYPINIDLHVDWKRKYSTIIENGDAHICIEGGYIRHQCNDTTNEICHKRTVIVPENATFQILEENHPIRMFHNFHHRLSSNDVTQNILSNTTGTMSGLSKQQQNYFYGRKRLLVVRVITYGGTEQPVETLDEIEGAIFGTGINPENIPVNSTIVGQYKAISQGNLVFEPVSTISILKSTAFNDSLSETINIYNSTSNQSVITSVIKSTNGVIEVELPSYIQTFQGLNIREYLVPEILKATEAALLFDNGNSISSLEDIADYFIFCIPNSSLLRDDSTWTAFTYLYEPYSYYQQSRCTKLSVVVHEMGHGLGFKHSGQNGNEYADKTGYMGYAVNFPGTPRKAFNAHKHWLSGWFRDRAIDLSSAMIEQGVRIQLAAFIDYGTLQQQRMRQSNPTNHNYHVLVRLNGIFFMQYNYADSYNIGTDPIHANHVVGVEAPDPVTVSDLKASLEDGGTYLYIFNASQIAVIYVCEMNEDKSDGANYSIRYARLSIYFMNDGKNMSDKERCSNKDSIKLFPTVSPAAPLVDGDDDQYPPRAPVDSLPEILENAPTASPTKDSHGAGTTPPPPNNKPINSTPNKEIEIEGTYSEEDESPIENKAVWIPVVVSSSLFIVLMTVFIALLLWSRKSQKKDNVNKARRSNSKTDLVDIAPNRNFENNTSRDSCSAEEENSTSDFDNSQRLPCDTVVTSWGEIVSSATKIEAYITLQAEPTKHICMAPSGDSEIAADNNRGYNFSRTKCHVRQVDNTCDLTKSGDTDNKPIDTAANQCERIHI